MKKFVIALSTLLLSSTAFASWTQEQKDTFSELLWVPEQAATPEDTMNLVQFIDCLTKYYESKYTFEQVHRWWYEPPRTELVKEFVIVNAECKRMILAQVNSTSI
jgi:hypothetical protein